MTRSAVVASLVLSAALAGAARGQEPSPAPGSFNAALQRLSAVWTARNVDGYMALWTGLGSSGQETERSFAEDHFAAGESQLYLQQPVAEPRTNRVGVGVQTFTVREPRAMVEDWMFVFERKGEAWLILERQQLGRVDGLVHLSLAPEGYRAEGLKLAFEDFELSMTKGTFFMPPTSLGPTLLVFVGEGRVRFTPKPGTERDQLRQFGGRPELVDDVRSAFIRVHPADLLHVLTPARFEPDPKSSDRLAAAQRLYREQVGYSFVLDANLPGAPWSLLPGLGDSLTTFETSDHGTLTLTISSSQAESISLFDRERRRQICLYPGGGRSTRYGEDEGRNADLIEHDIRLRADPGEVTKLEGEDTLRLRLASPAPTVRLRLDQGLRVRSVTSAAGGQLLFFRVRNRDELMVSLGALGAKPGEITLSVRYSGALTPGPIEREVLEGPPTYSADDMVQLENILVFTNRNAWYPQTESDDYATATLRFDLPVGHTAVTGGVRTGARVENGRVLVEYRQDLPGKYISVAIGRLREAGSAREGSVALEAYGTSRTRRGAAETLAMASQILRFFGEEFGPAPYPTLNIVLVEGRTPGGHSPPGMIVLSQRPLMMRGALKDDPGSISSVPGFFLAHEIAHQWWGHGIAGQNYHERWLSEGIAQYAAALWVRKSAGEGAFRDVLRKMAYWALRDSREGPISLGYRLGHLKEDPQIYRALVYDKAAYVLHMLRAITGDETFRKGMTALQQEHRFQKVGTDDLRRALEVASGLELSSYFEAWVYGTAVPTLRVSDRSERTGSAGHRTAVTVTAEGLPGPVPLELVVTHGARREARRVTLVPPGGTFTLDTQGEPGRVEVNADYGLLAAIRR